METPTQTTVAIFDSLRKSNCTRFYVRCWGAEGSQYIVVDNDQSDFYTINMELSALVWSQAARITLLDGTEQRVERVGEDLWRPGRGTRPVGGSTYG